MIKYKLKLGGYFHLKLLVLDGNSILNRAFYGIKLLSTKDGYFTNGIYGFLTILNKIKDETDPDFIAIAFDLKAPTFRHDEYKDYKANRKGMPEELAQQLPILKELLSYMGYKIVECEGFEADDILGTLAKSCEEKGYECLIATGDKDSLQLVSKNTSVRIAATKFGRPDVTIYDEKKIMETYGVAPAQLIDIKAIQGDTSDNIPGIKGIGQKGATELVKKFKTLDYIYENIETIDIKEGIKEKLIGGKENAYMSRKLGTVRTDAPINTNIDYYVQNECDREKTFALMSKLEFSKMIEKMGLRDNTKCFDNSLIDCKIKITESSDFKNLTDKIKRLGEIVFLAEYKAGDIDKITLYAGEDIHLIKKADGFSAFLKTIFEDSSIKKLTYNSKLLHSVLNKMEIDLVNVDFDVLLAAYLLNPSASSYSLHELSLQYGIEYINLNNAVEEDSELLSNIFLLPKLIDKLSIDIKKNSQEFLLREVEIPLSKVLADMESIGFLVKPDEIKEYSKILGNEISKLTEKIYSEAGYEFNINSPKQLGAALFEKMMLPKGKKTKSGYSTSAEVLENLRYSYPVVDLILQFRELSKLKSTYCEGLLKAIGSDKRIHSKFNQVETRTGRISSTEPNLQNIPVRTELGKEFRKFFCAKDGFVLVDADYSQIELRVLAHVSKDKNMIDAFRNKYDIHAITASQVFNIPLNMVTPLMRNRAKAVNFGIIYGIGAFSLSKNIGVSRNEAANYIDAYLSHYSGVNRYMKEIVELAKERGYAESIFGRRLYLPELSSSNFNIRSFGERVARNMPIQGAAADIIKIAMIKTVKRLEREKLKSKLILQVHDELIVEAPFDEKDTVSEILKQEMEKATDLLVPLVADVSSGKTWYDAKL